MIRTGILINGSAVITGLRRTSDIDIGLYVYGDGIPVGSYIESIDSSSQITLNANCTVSGSVSLEFSTANVGTYHERVCMLKDVQNIVKERGDLLKINLRLEDNIIRDKYNSIQKRKNEKIYFFRAYPIEYSPAENRLEKAGLRQEARVIVYTAMQDWIDAGIDYGDINLDLKQTATLQGETYEIIEKAFVSQANDSYLYITLGLNLR